MNNINITSILSNPSAWELNFTKHFTPDYPNTYSNSDVRCTWFCQLYTKDEKHKYVGKFFIDCHINDKNMLEVGFQTASDETSTSIDISKLHRNYDLFDVLDILKNIGFEITINTIRISSAKPNDNRVQRVRLSLKDRIDNSKLYTTFKW